MSQRAVLYVPSVKYYQNGQRQKKDVLVMLSEELAHAVQVVEHPEGFKGGPKLSLEHAIYRSLEKRDQLSETYVGHGIAQPHSLQPNGWDRIEDRLPPLPIQNHYTAILAFKQGVRWSEHGDAYLVQGLIHPPNRQHENLLLQEHFMKIFHDPQCRTYLNWTYDSNSLLRNLLWLESVGLYLTDAVQLWKPDGIMHLDEIARLTVRPRKRKPKQALNAL